MKFRKKPIIIEAIKFTYENLIEIRKFVGDKLLISPYPNEQDVIQIKTLEGNHTAKLGDWIIKGIKGEFYPCKPDIFEQTYEKAD